MDADKAAKRMLKAMARGEREILIAKGVERHIAQLRRKSPNKLFDAMEKMMASGYAQKMKDSGEG